MNSKDEHNSINLSYLEKNIQAITPCLEEDSHGSCTRQPKLMTKSFRQIPPQKCMGWYVISCSIRTIHVNLGCRHSVD